MRRVVLGAFSVALTCLLTASALAETVTYSTLGYFNGNPVATSVTKGTGTSSATLSFLGFSDSVDAPTVAKMGTFATVIGSSSNFIEDFLGTTFTLEISQIDPQIGQGTVSSKLTGVLKRSRTGVAGSTLYVDFEGASLTLPPSGLPSATYAPINVFISPTTATTLEAHVEHNAHAVPVPAAVWGGMTLLGLLGSGRLWKRRRALA